MQVFSISPSNLAALRDALLHSLSILKKVNAYDIGAGFNILSSSKQR
jgi:hypothetical protein